MSTDTAAAPAPQEHAWLTPVELLVLGAIWGASFLFTRVAARDLGPFLLVEIRLALGALVLLPFLWRARAKFPLAIWPKIALIGAINGAIPFILFAWAAHRAPAGISAISNAMTVPFTALVGALFFGEKIGWQRALAIGTGLGGVIVLASGKTEGASLGLPVIAGTIASFLYGVGINLVRRHLSGLPPAAVASATLSTSTLLTLPFALADLPQHPITAATWYSSALLGVVCTGLAFVMYYRLIARVGAARASTVTYLIPLFGVAWAWLLLDEPVTTTMAIACAVILGSVAMSQRAPK